MTMENSFFAQNNSPDRILDFLLSTEIEDRLTGIHLIQMSKKSMQEDPEILGAIIPIFLLDFQLLNETNKIWNADYLPVHIVERFPKPLIVNEEFESVNFLNIFPVFLAVEEKQHKTMVFNTINILDHLFTRFPENFPIDNDELFFKVLINVFAEKHLNDDILKLKICASNLTYEDVALHEPVFIYELIKNKVNFTKESIQCLVDKYAKHFKNISPESLYKLICERMLSE